MEKVYVISFGGSLLMNAEMQFDITFIKNMKLLLWDRIEKGDKFILVVGGGKTARYYQKAGQELGLSQEDLDWIGIKTTYLNAEFIKRVFEADSDKLYHSPEDIPENLDKSLYIATGWKPGWSTDYVMVKIAERLNIKNLINLSNTDYIYDDDPNKNPNAKIIKEMTWKDYLADINVDEWKPGLNLPFDPIASKLADEIDATLFYMNGKNVDNFRDFLEGYSFEASIIKNK